MFIGIYKKRTTLLTMFDFWLFLSWLSIYSGTRLIGTCTGHTIVSILFRCLYSAGLQKNATDTCLINIKTNADNFIRKHCLISHTVMYRSNRSFNMPPPGNPPGIWLFWKLLFKFPPIQAKMPFKCPTLGSIQVIKCPHPGDISQAWKWQKDGGNAFSCRTKSFYKYNKNWETLLAYLLRTKVSCKAAEIAATRSLNAQLFFVMHYIKRYIKKRSHLLRLLHHDHFTDTHHRSPY